MLLVEFDGVKEVVEVADAESDCKETVGAFRFPATEPLDGLRCNITGLGEYPTPELDAIGMVDALLAVVVNDFSGVLLPIDLSVDGVESDGLKEFIRVLFSASGDGFV